MDWLEFFSGLVGSLAWPVALCVVAWLLRAELRGLFGRLERIKARDVEASFTRRVEEVAEGQAASESPDGDKTPNLSVAEVEKGGAFQPPREFVIGGGPVTMSRWLKASELATELVDQPEAAILASWETMEKWLGNAATVVSMGDANFERYGFLSNTNQPVDASLRVLQRAGVVNASEVATVQSLRYLRNEIAHSSRNPSATAALKYAEAVDNLVERVLTALVRWRPPLRETQGKDVP